MTSCIGSSLEAWTGQVGHKQNVGQVSLKPKRFPWPALPHVPLRPHLQPRYPWGMIVSNPAISRPLLKNNKQGPTQSLCLCSLLCPRCSVPGGLACAMVNYMHQFIWVTRWPDISSDITLNVLVRVFQDEILRDTHFASVEWVQQIVLPHIGGPGPICWRHE